MDTPNSSDQTANPARPFQFGLLAILGLMVLVGGLSAVIGVPIARARRDAALKGNLRLLGLAFHQYYDVYKSFPPSYVTDADGTPIHSWRVLILPFVDTPDAKRMAEQYEYDEPWNSPTNLAVAVQMPEVFRSPRRRNGRPETDYLVITGPGTLFEKDRGTQLQQVTDGLSNTLLLVEVFESGVPWTAPRDLDFTKIPMALVPSTRKGNAGGIKGSEADGALVCFADGYVARLPNSISAETLKRLILRNDGEVINEAEFRRN